MLSFAFPVKLNIGREGVREVKGSERGKGWKFKRLKV
jgi:hypothetical protein